MNKAITPIISIVLLIAMTVTSSAFAFIWFNTVQSTVQGGITGNAENFPASKCTSMQLVSVRGDSVTVANDGCDTIGSVSLFIDGKLTNYDLTNPLAPGEAATIQFSQMEEGKLHEVIVVLGNGEAVSEAITADECSYDAGCSQFNFTISGVTVS